MPVRPNVVFLMTDHAGEKYMAPGGQCLTPNLDALAAEGVRFRRCYSTNAICSPSRASLLTGTYPSTHGVFDCTHTQQPEWLDIREHLVHWPQRLHDAGYRTAYYGKWHAEQSEQLERFGWDEYDTGVQGARVPRVKGSEVVLHNEGYRDTVLTADAANGDEPVRHPGIEKGIDFIRRHAGGEAPFCCFVSMIEPGGAVVAPTQFMSMYDVDSVALPPSLHDDLLDKPEMLRRIRDSWKSITDDEWRRTLASYLAVITFVDHEIGRVLEVLKEVGAYDDTIVVFTSDHGQMVGAKGIMGLGLCLSYEDVYNIPLIIRAPRVTDGRIDTDSLVSTVDMAPTLLDLVGLEPAPDCQGRSLRPVLEGTADPDEWREAYAEFYSQRFFYTQRLVWHDEWKFVFSPGGIDELYNFADDPDERNNLAQDPAHQDKLVEMTKRMWRKMLAIGDHWLFESDYRTMRTAAIGPHSVEGE